MEIQRRAWALLAASVLSGAGAATAAQPKPTTHTVDIEAMQFSPATFDVKAGDTVIWRNKDPFPHNVAANNKGFRSGAIPAGQSWSFKARKKGEFAYVCTLHPNMKAALRVK